MMIIIKPIKAVFAPNILFRVLNFIRKGVLKYFLFTIVLVTIIQTIRHQSLFTSGTLMLSIIIFLVFVVIGLGLSLISTILYHLASQKELLEVELSDAGLRINSKHKSAHEAKAKLITWDHIKNVTVEDRYYCFVFDKKQTSGFKLKQDYLTGDEKRHLLNWLKEKVNISL